MNLSCNVHGQLLSCAISLCWKLSFRQLKNFYIRSAKCTGLHYLFIYLFSFFMTYVNPNAFRRTSTPPCCHIQTKPQGGDFRRAHPAHVPPRRAERRMRRENVNNMPEPSRETETEEGRGDGQQRREGNRTSANIVSLISQFADDNLTLVRVGVSFAWPATDWWCVAMDGHCGHCHSVGALPVYWNI